MSIQWTREQLVDEFIGREESLTLEFKSSKGLINPQPSQVDGFIDDLSRHISAFLNSEGGLLIIGIEEASQRDKKRAEKAIALSDGVLRSTWTASRLASMLCGRIHPAVASFVQVHPVVVEVRDGEDLLAFVVEVKAGVTAYQAADKKYYGRRSYSSEALEDKEIRLRMLADDRPRAQLRLSIEVFPSAGSWDSIESQWTNYNDRVSQIRGRYTTQLDTPNEFDAAKIEESTSLIFERPMPIRRGCVRLRVQLLNIGFVTIRRIAIESHVSISGHFYLLNGPRPKIVEVFFDRDDNPPLYPEMLASCASWDYGFDRGVDFSAVEGSFDVTAYLDNGIAVRESLSVAEELQDSMARFNERLDVLEQSWRPA